MTKDPANEGRENHGVKTLETPELELNKLRKEREREDLDILYQRTRDQIEHEDGLVNQRLTWLLVFQTFLFIAYANLLNEAVRLPSDKILVLTVVAALGFLSSFSTLIVIMQALSSLNYLRRSWREEFAKSAADFKRRFPEVNYRDKSLWRRFGSSGMIPILLMTAWSVLACTRLYHSPTVNLTCCDLDKKSAFALSALVIGLGLSLTMLISLQRIISASDDGTSSEDSSKDSNQAPDDGPRKESNLT